MTRRLEIWVAVLGVLLLTAACGGDSPAPAAPTPAPVIPACQANHTASVSFGNRSSATTHTVVWDGATQATLAPGATSAPITAAAGVAHVLQYFITNTQLLACATSSPVPVECATPVYTCAFP